jgi:hypothetical protein
MNPRKDGFVPPPALLWDWLAAYLFGLSPAPGTNLFWDGKYGGAIGGYGMPILSGQSLMTMLGAEISRYFHPLAIPQSVPTAFYAWALHAEYFVIGLSLAMAIWFARKERMAAVLVTGLFTVIFGMALIVARKYAGYSLLTLPWMAFLVGHAVSKIDGQFTPIGSIARRRIWRGSLAATGVLLLFMGTKAVIAQGMNPLPYVRVCHELDRIIPVGSRVLGPGQFWLSLPGRDYRDSNFLIFEKWLTNSSLHVGPALDRVQPDFIIVDEALNRLLVHYAQHGSHHTFSLVSRVQNQEPGKELLVLKVRSTQEKPPF